MPTARDEAIREAQELADQNRETFVVYGSVNDRNSFWVSAASEAQWMRGDDAYTVKRVAPSKAEAV